MKKILQIILIIILFVVSGLVFWAGLSPVTFKNFFSLYPKVGWAISRFGILNNQPLDVSDLALSEEILSSKGEVIIKGNAWDVEIAKTDEEKMNGLSNRKALHNKTGLLFVFDKMSTQSFWMKDMLIPIDMIFFDEEWRIVEINANLSPNSFPKIFGNKIKSQYVLEVNANESVIYDLQMGDQAVFLNK